MNKYAYIFYHVIGFHMNESPKQIMERKVNDLKNNPYSLWTAKIDKNSIDMVRQLSENDEIYVLCRINESAKSPEGDECTAVKITWDDEEEIISSNISPVTYPEGKKYQAYVVAEYQILDNPMLYDFSGYLSPNGKTFKVRMDEFTRFQNCFGKLDENILEDSKIKDISVIMKLKYPFVVDVE